MVCILPSSMRAGSLGQLLSPTKMGTSLLHLISVCIILDLVRSAAERKAAEEKNVLFERYSKSRPLLAIFAFSL